MDLRPRACPFFQVARREEHGNRPEHQHGEFEGEGDVHQFEGEHPQPAKTHRNDKKSGPAEDKRLNIVAEGRDKYRLHETLDAMSEAAPFYLECEDISYWHLFRLSEEDNRHDDNYRRQSEHDYRGEQDQANRFHAVSPRQSKNGIHQ